MVLAQVIERLLKGTEMKVIKLVFTYEIMSFTIKEGIQTNEKQIVC